MVAVHDWNKNGKKDIQDDFIEYKIYQESIKSNNGSDNSGCGAWGWIAVIVIFLSLLSKCGG